VHGGQQINVIPDKCQASVDWRIIPGRDGPQCRDELNKVLQQELPEQIEVSVLNEYKPMITDEDHGLVLSLLDAAEQVTGRRKTTVFSGATDASAFVSLTIPTPIFGPGGMGQAHTQEEYIEISKLEQGLETYRIFLAGNWFKG
jgi:acetylornithine deacetylase/succinyl-diaminopimelate desuccinylase-like protein